MEPRLQHPLLAQLSAKLLAVQSQLQSKEIARKREEVVSSAAHETKTHDAELQAKLQERTAAAAIAKEERDAALREASLLRSSLQARVDVGEKQQATILRLEEQTRQQTRECIAIDGRFQATQALVTRLEGELASVKKSIIEAERSQQGWETIVADLRAKVALAIDSAKRNTSRIEAQQETLLRREREAKEAQHVTAEREREIASLRKEIAELRAVIDANNLLAEERNAAFNALEIQKQEAQQQVLTLEALLRAITNEAKDGSAAPTKPSGGDAEVKYAALSDLLNRLEEENTQLRQLLAAKATPAPKEIAPTIEGELAILLDEMKQMRESMQQTSAEVASVREERDRLRDEVSKQELALNESKLKLHSAQEQIKALEAKQKQQQTQQSAVALPQQPGRDAAPTTRIPAAAEERAPASAPTLQQQTNDTASEQAPVDRPFSRLASDARTRTVQPQSKPDDPHATKRAAVFAAHQGIDQYATSAFAGAEKSSVGVAKSKPTVTADAQHKLTKGSSGGGEFFPMPHSVASQQQVPLDPTQGYLAIVAAAERAEAGAAKAKQDGAGHREEGAMKRVRLQRPEKYFVEDIDEEADDGNTDGVARASQGF